MMEAGRDIYARQFSLPEIGLGIVRRLPNQQARQDLESW